MLYYRDSWAEINLDAIYQNVNHIKQHLPSQTLVMAIVKANGYGHGAVEVAETALEAGATWLGVALLDEALVLRKQGIKAPILVLGWTRPEDIHIASDYSISLTVFQNEWLLEARRLYQGENPVFLHIKCDTGMGRIGVRTKEELADVVKIIQEEPRFILEGAFTHFATADEPDPAFFHEQERSFKDFVDYFNELGVQPNVIHAANSAAALKKEGNLYNMVRYGIAMYGLSPSPAMKEQLPFKLEESFSLYSKLVHVKRIAEGETVGYGATYKAKKETWIGTLPIGYADGWLRRLSGSDVLIDGKRVPIIGRICMDQLMLELDRPYPIGTTVTLIGKDIPIDEIADRLETINYEVPCMINERIPRIYLKNGKKVKEKNPILPE
ncbi:alanine racemase [Pullulanibacillus sp. KACC 23026]|uniref:alanine racemase n=1 Tax=Pullulanibacillus sp. KACC 23026 TaxID=3028315 RepID=UPI0023B143B2|nr:alanine racemase [Pullulanibacillus sp. KACC 23026]WEG12530.1 alanine racemase [Pullulanibacillus sp. KACC 23026]